MSEGSFNGLVDLHGGWVIADASLRVDTRQPTDGWPDSPSVVLEPRSVVVTGPSDWPGRAVNLTVQSHRYWPTHADHMRAGGWSPTSRWVIETQGRIQVRRLTGEVLAEIELHSRPEGPVGRIEVVWSVGDRQPWHPRGVASELWVRAWYIEELAPLPSLASDEGDEANEEDEEDELVETSDSRAGDRFKRLGETFGRAGTPLIRTDFSDDAAWGRVVAEVTRATLFEGSAYGEYEPNVTVFDDPAFEGVTGESLAQICAPRDDLRGYVVLADARSMAEARNRTELTVGYVDLSVEDDEDAELFDSYLGRTFRCAVPAFSSIESNLAIANMDFHDFADNVAQDGVFRGFASAD